MIPIYEQGNSQGIGHSFETFVNRFQEICKNHIESKRAHSFAFLFYDFNNDAIKEVLKSNGGFARLDRLSGSELSLFYLHSDNPELINSFNDVFRYSFDIDESISLPFVLFVKFDGEINEIENIKISLLEQDNYLFAFDELYSIIDDYIKLTEDKVELRNNGQNKLIQVLDNFKKIGVEEFIKMVFQDGFKKLNEYF